jgi:hypothetical protein
MPMATRMRTRTRSGSLRRGVRPCGTPMETGVAASGQNGVRHKSDVRR